MIITSRKVIIIIFNFSFHVKCVDAENVTKKEKKRTSNLIYFSDINFFSLRVALKES